MLDEKMIVEIGWWMKAYNEKRWKEEKKKAVFGRMENQKCTWVWEVSKGLLKKGGFEMTVYSEDEFLTKEEQKVDYIAETDRNDGCGDTEDDEE